MSEDTPLTVSADVAEPAPSRPSEALPPATPVRNVKLGLALFLLGGLASFFMMSVDVQLRHGPLFGMLVTFIAALGVLELCGLLRATSDMPAIGRDFLAPKADEPAILAPRVTLPLALLIVSVGLAAFGFAHAHWVVASALIALLPSALRRPSLFVFVSSSLLFLPMLGQYGLWDPWETHYGEVSREILARDDWITLWWAQDEWFRSKPVFIFWIEALTWGSLGIPFRADANPAHPEWALRLPIYLLSETALLTCYAAVARFFGKRAGVVAALVLTTTPYFFFLAHQAITDMPFVATMSAAMALLAFGLDCDPKEEVRAVRVGPFRVSFQGFVIFAFVVSALPQALYLISRNITFVTHDFGFWLHRDEFMFGSAGNEDIPGNPAHRMRGAYLASLAFQPLVQGLLWGIGLFALVFMLRKERRTQTLAMYGFYLFASFAWMAKGIPGFALPGLIAGLYLLVTGRWSLLLSGKLRIGAGVLTIAVTGLPWYVAMYGRLGPFFTDRLLIHDHINRLASGVHGDTGSIQYFLWQLGYGAFPWIGLFPIAFLAFRVLSKGDATDKAQERVLILFALWAAASFTLFNAMITKFHHYIFPAVPPLALLVGIMFDKLLGPHEQRSSRVAIALAALSPLPLVIGVAGRFGNVRGVIPQNVKDADKATWIAQQALNPTLSAGLILLGLIGLIAAWLWSERSGEQRPRTSTDVALSIGLFGAAIVAAFAGRDLSWTTTHRPLGHERLIDLFVYNYQRPFPEHLDYRPILTGFSVVIFALLLAASVYALRKVAIYAALGCAFMFAVWSLDVYLIDLSPHWGQRELVKRYYKERKSNKEPLLAWQMNWKGENIYTGNRVHVFVQLDNKAITEWMDRHKGSRAYFLLEHSRLGNFKRMMGTRTVEELTTIRDNNKFLLVRANI